MATERGDATACRTLVEAFLPAIASVARRFDASGRIQRTDLMQEGVAGLLFAAQRYDPALETPFWAYASFWVRKAMQVLDAEVSRPVALSDHAVRALGRIRATRDAYVQAHGAEPTRAALAAATGLTEGQLDRLLTTERPARSFDEPLGVADAAATFGDTIPDPGAETAYDRVLERMELEAVRDLADELDERERAVLGRHYGLGRPEETLTAIGSTLGLTAERVRQIENSALAKLREATAHPPVREAAALEPRYAARTPRP